jgi:hypothetical protein
MPALEGSHFAGRKVDLDASRFYAFYAVLDHRGAVRPEPVAPTGNVDDWRVKSQGVVTCHREGAGVLDIPGRFAPRDKAHNSWPWRTGARRPKQKLVVLDLRVRYLGRLAARLRFWANKKNMGRAGGEDHVYEKVLVRQDPERSSTEVLEAGSLGSYGVDAGGQYDAVFAALAHLDVAALPASVNGYTCSRQKAAVGREGGAMYGGAAGLAGARRRRDYGQRPD